MNAVGPEALVRLQDDLGVALGAKPAAGPFELKSELAVVVQLTIVGNPCCAGRVRHWLVSRGAHIDDREPPVSKPNPLRKVDTFIVRPPMYEHPEHPRHLRVIHCRAVSTENPGDTRDLPRTNRFAPARIKVLPSPDAAIPTQSSAPLPTSSNPQERRSRQVL